MLLRNMVQSHSMQTRIMKSSILCCTTVSLVDIQLKNRGTSTTQWSTLGSLRRKRRHCQQINLFEEAFPEMQDFWYKFHRVDVLDYLETILAIAREILWRELKKCMTEDPEPGAKWTGADTDSFFTEEVDYPGCKAFEEHGSKPSHAKEDHETRDNKQLSQGDGALVVSGGYEESVRQHDHFLQVSFDVLQDEYREIDQSYAFTNSNVGSFIKEHEALVDGDFLNGVTFSEDSDKKYMICFSKSIDPFKWLFYAPSSGVVPKPLPQIREVNCVKGYKLLDCIKEKMKTLPTYKSSTEALPRIQELWHKFLKYSTMDYRGDIMVLSRTFGELKKYMTKDELCAKWIIAADIDASTKEVDNPGSIAVEEHGSKPSHAEEDHETGDSKQPSEANGALMVSVYHEESNAPAEHEESSGTPPANKAELSDLDKLEIDPMISENKQKYVVQVKGDSCWGMVTETQSSDPAINMVGSGGDDPGAKMGNLQIDPSCNSSIVTGASSTSGQDGQQQCKTDQDTSPARMV